MYLGWGNTYMRFGYYRVNVLGVGQYLHETWLLQGECTWGGAILTWDLVITGWMYLGWERTYHETWLLQGECTWGWAILTWDLVITGWMYLGWERTYMRLGYYRVNVLGVGQYLHETWLLQGECTWGGKGLTWDLVITGWMYLGWGNTYMRLGYYRVNVLGVGAILTWDLAITGWMYLGWCRTYMRLGYYRVNVLRVRQYLHETWLLQGECTWGEAILTWDLAITGWMYLGWGNTYMRLGYYRVNVLGVRQYLHETWLLQGECTWGGAGLTWDLAITGWMYLGWGRTYMRLGYYRVNVLGVVQDLHETWLLQGQCTWGGAGLTWDLAITGSMYLGWGNTYMRLGYYRVNVLGVGQYLHETRQPEFFCFCRNTFPSYWKDLAITGWMHLGWGNTYIRLGYYRVNVLGVGQYLHETRQPEFFRFCRNTFPSYWKDLAITGWMFLGLGNTYMRLGYYRVNVLGVGQYLHETCQPEFFVSDVIHPLTVGKTWLSQGQCIADHLTWDYAPDQVSTCRKPNSMAHPATNQEIQ